MNIVFCSRVDINPLKGGVEKVTIGLTEYFLAQGHKVFYVVLVQTETEIKYSVPVFYLVDKDPYSQSNIQEYNRILDYVSADIVINQYAMSTPEVFLFSSIQNPAHKLINVLHSTPFALYKQFWRYTKSFSGAQFLIRLLLYPVLKLRYYNARLQHFKLLNKASDVVVTLCKKDMLELKPFIHKPKLTYIHNFINGSNADSFVDVKSKKKIMLLVSRMEKTEKAPQNLIPIWKEISSKCPDWHLKILGNGPDKDWVENEFRKAKLERYEFLGFQDPTPYYKEASIFTLVSNTEGFGLVLLEAMVNQIVPFAYSSSNATYDILFQETVVPAFDAHEYATRVIDLINKPDKLQQLRSRYIDKVQDFAIDKIGEQWLYLFQSLQKE